MKINLQVSQEMLYFMETKQKEMDEIEGKTIVVWFSCGAASAVALQKTIEKYGKNNRIIAVNNPVLEEDEDNRRFLHDVEKWLGVPVELAVNPEYQDASCNSVWRKRRYMSGVRGAPCTMQLKKVARQKWEESNQFDYLVLGFTYEEKNRFDRFKMFERENILPVLIEDGITKLDCYQIIMQAGIELPRIYKMGYPNANCIGCVKSQSATYWNHVRKMHPHVFNERSKLSRELGCKLVRWKGKRMFLDELPKNAIGRPMKNLDFECGIFCEMK